MEDYGITSLSRLRNPEAAPRTCEKCENDCSPCLWRYWFAEPAADAARRFGRRENTARTILFRGRKRLRCYLEKEVLL